jgi:hypothetical protein
MIVAALSLVIIVVFGGDRITQANVDRIQDGMSLEMVCEILGAPPTKPYHVTPIEHMAEFTGYAWEGNNGWAVVIFDKDGVRATDFRPLPSTLWSRIKNYFGL